MNILIAIAVVLALAIAIGGHSEQWQGEAVSDCTEQRWLEGRCNDPQ